MLSEATTVHVYGVFYRNRGQWLCVVRGDRPHSLGKNWTIQIGERTGWRDSLLGSLVTPHCREPPRGFCRALSSDTISSGRRGVGVEPRHVLRDKDTCGLLQSPQQICLRLRDHTHRYGSQRLLSWATSWFSQWMELNSSGEGCLETGHTCFSKALKRLQRCGFSDVLEPSAPI